jgi:transport and Golgi organization protein 2
MCTVTIVPREGGFRLVCNRDERYDRPAALPPASTAQHAIYPIDPVSGGTWVGVNDDGLAAALLNRTTDSISRLERPAQSRGVIIPQLLACASLWDAMRTADRFDSGSFEPFTLVLIQDATVGVVASGQGTRCSQVSSLFVPLLFTSSSLGDDLVEAPRRRLFRQLVVGPEDRWLSGQFLFHRSQWPGHSELSVHMRRADAATVSRTLIDVNGSSIKLSYTPLETATSRLLGINAA